MTLALAVLVALAVDRLWGEPRESLHPVVWMGRYLGRSGAWVQRHTRQVPVGSSVLTSPHGPAPSALPDYKAFWLAAFVWCAGAAMVW